MVNLPKRLQGQTSSHARSKQQEKETANRLGGKVIHRSGAGFEKGDVVLRGVARIENKTTEKRSFSISVNHISKIEESISGTGEIPFMQIELMGGASKFIVMPDRYLEDIVYALQQLKENK